jgi:hypothetical protein
MRFCHAKPNDMAGEPVPVENGPFSNRWRAVTKDIGVDAALAEDHEPQVTAEICLMPWRELVAWTMGVSPFAPKLRLA